MKILSRSEAESLLEIFTICYFSDVPFPLKTLREIFPEGGWVADGGSMLSIAVLDMLFIDGGTSDGECFCIYL